MLILYTKTTCSYCNKVLNFAADTNIKIATKDIHSDQAILEDLMARGGKRQVPFLVDEKNGVQMYESIEIINYLKEKYVH